MKNPYNFSARSRADMISALESIGGRYDGRNRYPFAWNVKIHSIGDMTAAGLAEFDSGTGEPFSPAWDSAWAAHLERSDSLFWDICSDAGRYYTDGDYCTWAGNDQGDYGFEFHGRSGGWLVLTKWRGRSLRDFSIADDCGADSYASLTWPEVRQLYRAIETMNQDFTPAKIRAEFRSHLAMARGQWEEARHEAIESARGDQVENAGAALALLSEFRAARTAWQGRGGLGGVPVICATLRSVIMGRIASARAAGRIAGQLEAGVA